MVIEATAGLVLIQTWSVVSGTVDPRSAKRILPVAGDELLRRARALVAHLQSRTNFTPRNP